MDVLMWPLIRTYDLIIDLTNGDLFFSLIDALLSGVPFHINILSKLAK